MHSEKNTALRRAQVDNRSATHALRFALSDADSVRQLTTSKAARRHRVAEAGSGLRRTWNTKSLSRFNETGNLLHEGKSIRAVVHN
ncbi:hypothetical protein [Burkholderia anthina]|uniref:hypothetical protein n=1 Tax=Burkholderia anthina TaxID=179879 RepID=UPI0015890078|nr:hypothetical protein [Burkholderia anthina]